MSEGLIPKSMRRVYRAGSPFSDAAAAAGPVVLAGENAPPEEVTHETRHAEQFRVPGFPIMKLIEMLYPYGKGPLEQDAFRHEQPSHEMLREGPGQVGNPFDYGRGYSKAAQAYIRALLGE